MQDMNTVESRVRRLLGNFLQKSAIRDVGIHPTMDLLKDTGLTSLQGVEFVLELCDEFDFEFPADFNPLVDDKRRRGQTFQGLAKAVKLHLANKGAPSYGNK